MAQAAEALRLRVQRRRWEIVLDLIGGVVSALAGAVFPFLPAWARVFALLATVVIAGEILAVLAGIVGRLVQIALMVLVGLAFLRLVGA